MFAEINRDVEALRKRDHLPGDRGHAAPRSTGPCWSGHHEPSAQHPHLADELVLTGMVRGELDGDFLPLGQVDGHAEGVEDNPFRTGSVSCRLNTGRTGRPASTRIVSGE